MSKKLNIIEAMKMPIGTRFDFDIECDDTSFIEVLKGLEEPKILCWDGNPKSQVNICTSTSEMQLIPIQQPVSFMEVVNTCKRYRVECEGYTKASQYRYLHEALVEIIKGNPGKEDKALYDFITKGKWYIEESEELEDEAPNES